MSVSAAVTARSFPPGNRVDAIAPPLASRPVDDEPEVGYVVDAGVATVTLNRPAKLNAMTLTMQQLLRDRLAEADHDPDVRAVVLTGAGRGFCAGADLAVLDSLNADSASDSDADSASDSDADTARGLTTVAQPPRLATPLICAINGPTAGMGLSYALAADLRYAADTARISATFPRLGLVAEWGSAWWLTRLVGSAHAADLLLSGRTVDAAEALAMGLVQRVLPAAELVPAATAWARDVAQNCSPHSTAVIKGQLEAAAQETLDVAYGRSVELMAGSFGWPDLAEGLAARAEKRSPQFPSYLHTREKGLQ